MPEPDNDPNGVLVMVPEKLNEPDCAGAEKVLLPSVAVNCPPLTAPSDNAMLRPALVSPEPLALPPLLALKRPVSPVALTVDPPDELDELVGCRATWLASVRTS